MEKTQKVKKLSINTILFAISSFGTRLITFFFVPLYTYVLSTEEYGNLDLMVTSAQLLVPLLTLNIQDAVLRFAMDKKYKPEEVISVGMRVFAISSVFFIPLIVVASRLPYISTSLDTKYLWYLYVLFFTNAAYNILSVYLKAINKIKLLVVSGLVQTLITCVLNVLLLLVWKFGVSGYMIVNASGSLIVIMMMVLFGNVAGDIRARSSMRLFREMAAYSFPLVAGSISWWINNASDRYIVTFFCGAAVNGIYAVSYKIPTILSTFQGIFNNSWSISAIAEFDRNDSDGFISNVYNMYSLVSVLGCSAVLLADVFIAKLLYAKDFYQAWRFVPFLTLGTVFNGISLFEGYLFGAARRTKTVAATTVAGAAINTILNFSLIPLLGALGASIATCAGYFSIWAVRTYQLLKLVALKIDWKRQICTFLLLLCQCMIAVITEKFYYQLIFACLVILFQQKDLKKVYAAVKDITINKRRKRNMFREAIDPKKNFRGGAR